MLPEKSDRYRGVRMPMARGCEQLVGTHSQSHYASEHQQPSAVE